MGTEQQLQFLRERGCDQFQGYLMPPPLTPGELRQLLTGHTPARRTA